MSISRELLLRLARDSLERDIKEAGHDISFSNGTNGFLIRLRQLEAKISAYREIESEIAKEG